MGRFVFPKSQSSDTKNLVSSPIILIHLEEHVKSLFVSYLSSDWIVCSLRMMKKSGYDKMGMDYHTNPKAKIR